MSTSALARPFGSAVLVSAVLTSVWLAGVDGPPEAAAQRPSVEIYLPVVGQQWTTDGGTLGPYVEVEAQHGGTSWGVDVDGDTAYLGLGATVAAIDISDPDSPQVVGRSEVLPGVVKDLDAHDGYVYATVDDPHHLTGQGGLYTIDVRLPTRPRLASRFLTYGGGAGVAVDDDFAYLVSGPAPDMRSFVLRIVDVSRPSRLVQVGQLRLDAPIAQPILSGDRVYIGRYIVDVSERHRPRLVGSLTAPHHGAAVGASDDRRHVYVLGYSQRLTVLDLTDPQRAVEVGAVALEDNTELLWAAVGNDLAFITGHRFHWDDETDVGRLQVVDVSEPAAPRLVAAADVPGAALDVAVQWPVALMAHNVGLLDYHLEINSLRLHAFGGGLLIVDAEDADDPAIRGSIRRPGGFITAVDVDGGTAWFAEADKIWHEPGDANGRLWSLGSGVEVGRAPSIMGSIALLIKPIDLAVDAGVAYTAHDRDAVWAVDVRDAAMPEHVGPIYVAARTLAIQDGLLVATVPERDAIVTVDVADPIAPRMLGHLPYEMGRQRVPMTLESMLVWLLRGSLDVVDVSDPAQPSLAAVLPTQDWHILAADVAKAHAYVAAASIEGEGRELGSQSLVIFDLQNLTWPDAVGEVLLPTDGWAYGAAQEVSVSDDRAWVAMSSGAVMLVDVADTSAPRVTDRVDTPTYIRSTMPDEIWQYGRIRIRASGDRAHVAYDPGGLVVLRAVE